MEPQTSCSGAEAGSSMFPPQHFGALNSVEKCLPSHIYKSLPPLRSEGGDIRLVHLHPGKPTDPLECTLSCASLQTGPRYEALSYTWRSSHGGQEAPSVPLRIKETPIHVLPSLSNALQCLRSEEYDRVLWIDFLCINQADAAERGDQVRQMGTIYGRADQVMVFLGVEMPGIEDALQLLTHLANESDDDKHLPQMLESPTDPSAKSRKVSALAQLLQSGWFTRVWTIQERVMATQTTIQCGTYTFPWKLLEGADRGFDQHRTCCELFLQNNWDLDDMGAFLNRNIGRTRDPQTQLELSTLRELLVRLWGQSATDKRDHVFALLGLLAPEERLVEVDYSKPYWVVYTETALAILRRDRHLAYLVHVHNNDLSHDPALPSWVFDPSNAKRPMVLLPTAYSVYTAAGATQADIRRGFSTEDLVLRGFLVDRVASVRKAEPWPQGLNLASQEQMGMPTQEDARRLYQYLRDIESMADSLCHEARPPRSSPAQKGGTSHRREARTAAHITAACGIVRNNGFSASKLSAADEAKFQKAREVLQSYSEETQGRPITEFWDLIELGHVWPYCLTFTAFAQQSTFFLTSGENGQPRRMGMGPNGTQPGDQIFILAGGNMPFILRRLPAELNDQNLHQQSRA